MGSFDGKVAIVTGGASGIGHAIAQRLAIDGGTVVIFDIAGVDATATELGVTGLTVDVTDGAAVEGAMQSVVDRFGALHVLVNNAGTDGPAQPLGDYPPEGFDAVVAVNLRGTFLCLRFGIPHLIAAGGGAVVNISSAAALKGVAGLGPYSATKAGVIALTRTAALEYAGQGIRVNAVLPGAIDTPLLRHVLASTPGMVEAVTGQHPIGRLGTTDEVAATVAFLAGDDASFVTGAALAADGAYGTA